MPVQLKSREHDLIPMCNLCDGQLAVIVSDNSYNGRVVQMLKGKNEPFFAIKKDCVISVGLPNGATWSNPVPSSTKVRVLKAGESIQITTN